MNWNNITTLVFNEYVLNKFQLQDILKYGVDTLLNDDDSTDTNIDFAKILGPSVGGEWQVEEEASTSNDQEVLHPFYFNRISFYLSCGNLDILWKRCFPSSIMFNTAKKDLLLKEV